MESKFVANILKIAHGIIKKLDATLFYEISVKSLTIFNFEQKQDVQYLFSNYIFNSVYYCCEIAMRSLSIRENNDLLKVSLNNLNNIYDVYSQFLNLKQNTIEGLSIDLSYETVLSADWTYSPISFMYSEHKQNKQTLSEEQQANMLINCLRWNYLFETYFTNLAKLVNPVDRFCRLACTFLCSDNLFLNVEVHNLLGGCLKSILATNAKYLNFNTPIQGLNNFQDFYIQLLEQYRAVSYGDAVFGNFILLPLIQRNNVKYRKTLWSEYVEIAQVFNLTSQQVLCPTELFFDPPETDVSLIKCYRKALITGTVKKHSFLYQIASHHVQAFGLTKNK